MFDSKGVNGRLKISATQQCEFIMVDYCKITDVGMLFRDWTSGSCTTKMPRFHLHTFFKAASCLPYLFLCS